ncbi:MAG: type II secretion system protein GspD, partial [Candidatus Scalindua sp.]
YRDVITITDAILEARPYDGTAQALRENAQVLREDIRHKKVIAKIEQVNVQERNRYFENLKEKSIPYNDLMQFTNEDEWEDIKGRAQREDPEKRLEENREHTERLKLAPSPSQKPIPLEMQMKLEERLSIEFIDTPLRDVISFLQEKSDMNFFLDKDTPDTSVNIKLNDVPLSVILEYILPKGLSYIVRDNIIHITVEPLELRVYDVRDLLINLEDRQQGITAQVATEEGTASAGEGKDTFDRVNEIIDLITATIEPASWSANGGKGMIAAREGMLGDIVVTHILGVHKEIEGLLAALRSSTDLQISIEARFIAVSNNFLEAFGHNINEFDLTQGADDPKRRGIFTEAGDKFIDTGTTSALGATTGLNLTYQIFDGLFLKGFLKAVQESDEARTITAPKITLSNTQRGTIKVVTTVNYVESFTIVSQTPQPVIKQIDSGTTFSVRPIVSADRKYVYLEVHPIITTVTFDDNTNITFNTVGQAESGTTAGVAANTIQRPSTVIQELSVTVCVPDKGILMIGGLGTSSETKTSKGVPILSKIPIIKRLFSSDKLDRDITTAGNLIILIKPTILIREEEEARAFAKEKRGVEVRFPTYGR